jgi:mono/diheme cytochrome c family protein
MPPLRSLSRRPLLVAALLSAGSATHAAPSEPGTPGDPGPAPVTFAEHIAPIVLENCASCHRPGEAAPFPLLDYEDVKKRGRMVQLVTQTRYMPPWKPEPGYGEFRDARYLATDEVELIRQWVEGGMPEGDPSLAPSLPEFVDGWQLGKPDLVVTMDELYEVPPDGPDIYRNFVLPLPLDEDRWVTAVEVRPSARSVVHHVLFFLDDTGTARRLDEGDPGVGFDGLVFDGTGNLGGWAVGGLPRHLPLQLARPLSKDDDLVLQTHFHPTGKVEMEQTTVGLYFASEAPKRTLMEFQVPPEYGQYSGIDIPAGEATYVVHDTFEMPVDVDLIDVGGHAHYICAKMVGRATFPDGHTEPLIFIDDWDFNWQGWYQLAEPKRLPAGTVVDVELIYDNSAANPRNPHSPPQRVTWGLESTDEMGSLIFGAVPAREEDLGVFHMVSEGRRFARFEGDNGALALLARLKSMDRDGDGDIVRDEVATSARELVDVLDADRDGVWEASEIAALEERLK